MTRTYHHTNETWVRIDRVSVVAIYANKKGVLFFADGSQRDCTQSFAESVVERLSMCKTDEQTSKWVATEHINVIQQIGAVSYRIDTVAGYFVVTGDYAHAILAQMGLVEPEGDAN